MHRRAHAPRPGEIPTQAGGARSAIVAQATFKIWLVASRLARQLLPLAAVVRRPTSSRRLLADAFATSLAVIALVQLAWIALWLLEQRW